jgi:tetratricopeptide (TPR) repeat protein
MPTLIRSHRTLPVEANVLQRILIILTAGFCCIAGLTDAYAARNEDLIRAQSAAAAGDWEAVQAHAQKAVANDPKDADSWAMLASACLFLGDTAAAVQDYERAVERNPKLSGAVVDLTSLYVSMNRLEDADRVVAAAEKKDSRGKIDEIKVARALILGKQGDIASATAILASATGKNPDNPLFPRMLARIYRNAGVPDLAAVNYEKAWVLKEGDPELAFEYGQVLLNLKRYDEANRLFTIVQDRDPENLMVDYLRGRLLHAAGRYAEATAELEKAVKKRPDDFLSNYWLGRSYLDFAVSTGKNTFGLAVAPLSKALTLRPDRDDVAAELAKAIFEQGKFALRLANIDSTEEYKRERLIEAISFFHEARQNYSGLDDAFSNLARSFDKLNMLDSALYYTDLQIKTAILRLEDVQAVLSPLPPTPPDNPDGTPAEAPKRQLMLDVTAPEAQPFLVDENNIQRVAKQYPSDVTRKISLLQRLEDQRGLVEFLKPLMGVEEIFDKYGMILANAYIETREYDQGRELINRLLEKNPADCDLHQLNAYIDLKRERYGSAITVLLG